MFGPPEGIVWLTKRSLGYYVPDLKRPAAEREKEMKEMAELFYSRIWLDLAINANTSNHPKKKHPRTDFAVNGGSDNFDRVTVMYGKEPGKMSSYATYHQDGRHINQSLKASLHSVPMPSPEERFIWIDLTYAIRGVYIPLCFDTPWPYEDLVQLVRLDFTHRYIRLPFARPYDPMLYSQPERELLGPQIEKAGLEIMPERSLIDEKLHPILQNTTRFKKKILGEKGANSDGKPSDEGLFQDPSSKDAKAALQKWLKECNGKGPKHELEKAKRLDAVAKKHGIDRNPKFYRAEIDQDDLITEVSGTFKEQLLKWLEDFGKTLDQKPTDEQVKKRHAVLVEQLPFKDMTLKTLASQTGKERKNFVGVLVEKFRTSGALFFAESREEEMYGSGAATEFQAKAFRAWIAPDWEEISRTEDEYMGVPKFYPWSFHDRLALLSSPGGQPDCLISGHIDFATSTSLGLGLEHPDVTLRIDVREVQCFLALPSNMVKREGEKEVGYQNVSRSNGGETGIPINFYDRNLVVTFACRDVKIADGAMNHTAFAGKDTEIITLNEIGYPSLIQIELGLTMQYLPEPTSVEQQIASFMVQLIAIAVEAIPVVGPAASFIVYVGGNVLIDNAWINQFENSSPPVFALIYSQKGSISKFVGRQGKKLKLKLK
ncbi:hypothetical protein N7462_001813 [Penicillium macrosclerotiorum]|uniref:uncharacterized protein n=1 Tax=Penicillium macrosclerotiorum TaxID=303699 RepID=UPI002547F50E|nr:uncharacterized protein N7462_001813 [Penicillium macrosclerotiorum]KAJ5692390.1 hypothetical protein N7462_001813 [Penicillium macrosclerotiorum]